MQSLNFSADIFEINWPQTPKYGYAKPRIAKAIVKDKDKEPLIPAGNAYYN